MEQLEQFEQLREEKPTVWPRYLALVFLVAGVISFFIISNVEKSAIQ